MEKNPDDRPESWEAAIEKIEGALKPYNNPVQKNYSNSELTYSLKDDPKLISTILFIIHMTGGLFICFAYWTVKTAIP